MKVTRRQREGLEEWRLWKITSPAEAGSQCLFELN